MRWRDGSLAIALAAASLLWASAALAAGDVNCDGRVDDADLASLVGVVFAGGDCGGADVSGDGQVDAADVVALMAILAAGEAATPTVAATETPASEPTATPTSTSPPPPGPRIVFFGLAGADGRQLPTQGTRDGIPVYQRSSGLGFRVVVEGAPGSNGNAVGARILVPGGRPDLQIEATRALGDGSAAVCNTGVPAVDPPDFAPSSMIDDALNDLACRFAVATNPAASCTLDDLERNGFLSADARIQFCGLFDTVLALPQGETRLTVQLADGSGVLGERRQILVRAGVPPLPTDTPTPLVTIETPSRTPSPSRTPLAQATETSVATATWTTTPVATQTSTRTISPTPAATATGSRPPSATPTRTLPAPTTAAATATPTDTRSATATRTRTATITGTLPPSSTATRSGSATRTATGTATATRTATTAATPSRTGTPGATSTITRTPTIAPTSTATLVPTVTRTATITRTATRTGTPPPSPTSTRTRTNTGTPTPTGVPGPVVSFFGIANANGTLSTPIGTKNGIPVFARPLGFGFIIVVEGARGADKTSLGQSSFEYEEGNPDARPDLQILTDRSLGDGSGAVCDNSPPDFGGVPAVSPPSFAVTQGISNAMNDLGCRFVDGSGNTAARLANGACVLFGNGEYHFVDPQSLIEYCATVSQPLRFPKGDTLLSVRLRDVKGQVGGIAQIYVRSEG